MHFPGLWLLPSVESRERKLQLSRCVRFLGCSAVWIISVITCLLCLCHIHHFLKIGLWGLLKAAVWTCLFERKSARHGQMLFLSVSSSEDLKWHWNVHLEESCVWMVNLNCWSVCWREIVIEVLFVLWKSVSVCVFLIRCKNVVPLSCFRART